MLDDLLADAREKEIALAPREGHARRRVKAERAVAASLLFGEEEDVLENPLSGSDVGMTMRADLGVGEKFVVIAVAGADEVEPQTTTRAELERGDLLLLGDERHAVRQIAVRARVRAVHAQETGPARAAARQRDAVVPQEVVAAIARGERALEVFHELGHRERVRPR